MKPFSRNKPKARSKYMASPPQNTPRVELVGPFESSPDTAIDNAKWILSLTDGWDEDGAKSISPQTFQMAFTFLFYVDKYDLFRKVATDEPTVTPGPDRSIDLHWESADMELLINIPSYPGTSASFYLEFLNGLAVDGNIDLKNLQGSEL